MSPASFVQYSSMSTARRTALVSRSSPWFWRWQSSLSGSATGSLGILAEAAHSGHRRCLPRLLTVYAVEVAERPADPEHPYGHGKA